MQNTMLDSTTSNSLQLFENTDWKVRVVMRDGEPWFVAKDVCDCLDLDTSALRRLDDDEHETFNKSDFALNAESDVLTQKSPMYSSSGISNIGGMGVVPLPLLFYPVFGGFWL